MLKFPLWTKIVDLILMVVVPVVLAFVEISNASNAAYKISFVSILIVLTAWMFLNKFVISKYKEKLNGQIATLEINYGTGVGDREATLLMWKGCRTKILLLDAITVILVGLVGYFIIYGLYKQLLRFVGAYLLIAVSYLASFLVKIIYLWLKRSKD